MLVFISLISDNKTPHYHLNKHGDQISFQSNFGQHQGDRGETVHDRGDDSWQANKLNPSLQILQ
jgi:hypothetical protein